MQTGTWFRSDAGVRWQLETGAVCLDYAYLGGFGAGSFGPASGLPGATRDAAPASAAASAPAAESAPAGAPAPVAEPAPAGAPAPAAESAPAGAPAPAPAAAPAWDGLLVPADLGDWLAARYDGIMGAPTDRELQDARSFRDAVARLALCAADGHVPAGDDIDVVNLFAALPDVPPSLPGGRRQAGAGRLRIGQALASVARDAVTLFSSVGFVGDPERRLRRCAADDCGLVFHDDSRAGTRRWCSMQKCGNRAKVRAHRARAAASGAAASGAAASGAGVAPA